MSPILLCLRAFTMALVPLGISADIIAQQSSQDPTKAQKQNVLEEALRKLSNSEVAKSGIADTQKPILQQGPVRLIDISVDLLTSVGSSTERDSNIEDLQGGGHDPRQRGFTLQAAEVSLLGAVDPYFSAETHLLYFIDPEGESQVELEEAFVTTTSLPYGLELEVGQFLTEFGRINPQHPHSWDYQDQPVVLSRFFGEDGLRGVGLRAGWLVPAPWYMQLHAGVQNADGEGMVSFSANDEVFDERPIAGRPFVDQDVRSLDDMLYHLRLENSWDLSEESTVLFGASALFGPNATGDDGDTQIYGLDLLWKYKPEDSFHGSSTLSWQSEFLFRDYDADSFVDEGDPTIIGDETSFGAESLKDWGLYTQLIYGIAPDWQVGLRYEYSSGDGDNFDSSTVSLTSNQIDPYRDTRQRFSPLLSWRLSEYSRLRFQYNLDTTHWLDDDNAHSFWLGYEISFGAHPAHKVLMRNLMKNYLFLALIFLLISPARTQDASAPLRVCATTPNLGKLTEQIGGDQVEVSIFCRPGEDAHFVDAKPSFVRLLSKADLLVAVGLQLEIGWLPTLIRQSRNSKIQLGRNGYLDASQAITALEIRTQETDRSQGDVHSEGNPHYMTDPIRALAVAGLIAARLSELRPESADAFTGKVREFRQSLGKALVGEELMAIYEFEKLATLFEFGQLQSFLESQGDSAKLGGWLGKMVEHRGSKIVADHNAWPYFTRRFGLVTVGFLEPLPGIPPSTRHLRSILQKMTTEQVRLLLTVPYYDPRHAAFVKEHSTAKLVELSLQVRRGESYLGTMNANLGTLVDALSEEK